MAADPTSDSGARALGPYARALWIAAGAGIAAVGIGILPDLAVPAPDAPIGAAALVRIAFALTALAAVAVGATGWRLPRLAPEDRLRLPPPDGADVRRPLVWLAAITLVAAVLRVIEMGGSLWLDEIITTVHARQSLRELFTSPSLSNHLLHTLLVKGATRVGGYDEWVIRLPAVVLGVAAIPAVYALARVALRTREALLAALIIAASKTHVFSSQNSRGYAAIVLWTAVATWLLLRALSEDRARQWWGFAAASFLATASMVIGGFALMGQAAGLALVAHRVRRDGGRPGPIAIKGLAVIVAVGLVLLALYALALPSFYVTALPVGGADQVPATGSHPFGLRLWRSLENAFGVGGLVGLGVVALVLAPGAVRFLRRHLTYSVFLAAPLAPLAAAVLLFDLFAAPRYFVWALVPFAIGIVGAAALWPRHGRWAAPLVAGLVVVGSLAALRDYYGVPFQATRESVQWILDESAPADVVVPVRAAQAHARYYGRRLGLFRSRTVVLASSIEDIQAVERAYADRRILIMTAHYGGMERFDPNLARYIRRCYRPVRHFPGRIGGMRITIWTGRCAAPEGGGEAVVPTPPVARARSRP